MNIYNLFYKAPAPEGIEERNAHIIGGGIAGLAAAVFLIDDAGMPGKNITLYEKRNSLGGCCDAYSGEAGYICPGERELEPFMECLWYLCSKIPSLEDPSISVLDESVRANKDMPIHSESRLLCKQGHIYEKVHDYRMSPELLLKMEHFTSIPEKDLEDMTIEDYFGKDSEFFHSSLWWCYHSMLAFKPYHSALEAQRYAKTEEVTREELKRLDELLSDMYCNRPETDEDYVSKMQFACLLAAYIKRRSNLVMLAEKYQWINASELSLALKESLDYLSLMGAECFCDCTVTDKIDGHQAGIFYDFFEDCTAGSDCLPSAVILRLLKRGPNIVLRLESDRGGEALAAKIKAKYSGYDVAAETDDDTFYASLSLRPGGAV